MFNLHTYTDQGSMESIISVDQLMTVDSPVVSITDPNLISSIEFYQACKEHEKKPIIGLDAHVAFGQIDMLLQKYNQIASRITLIAYNEEGFQNLIRLSTIAHLEGFYKVPRIDIYKLQEYNVGLLCLINSMDSSIAYHRQNKNKAEAIKDLNAYRKIFKDRLYVEHFQRFEGIWEILDSKTTPYIATNHAKYMNHEDFYLWQDFMAINKNVLLEQFKQEGHIDWYAYNQRLDDVGDLWNLVDRIEDYKLDKMEAKFPQMRVSKDKFKAMLMVKMIKMGLKDKEYDQRLRYELSVINKFGYKDYFLMVKDVIDFCNRELSGYISAGRGSVGGCLVAYLLGITRIDPVNPLGFNMQIPFDRFLNSSRKVLPDIDLDFNPKDRQKVIDYLKNKYGEDQCRNMITVVTMGARGALRDVSRITNNLDSKMDGIIKSFPSDQHLTLDIVKESDIYKNNERDAIFVELFQTAQQLEGTPKSYGVHASGIAISSKPMDGFIPIAKVNDREVTQYKQDQLEYMGVVKFDILGLNTLQIIGDALKMINPKNDVEDNIEWLNGVALDDVAVHDFINTGKITGVFQWDTHNYKVVIQDVQPVNFKELVDLNTLGRSAALLSGLTDRYVRRKNGYETIEPLHPLLKGIMTETMELPLYQEQIMKIFMTLANYSQSEADDVRKAIGKKIPELMNKQREIFIGRCSDNGIDEDESGQIWQVIDKFSKYTWNLGHAMAYTRICYETAYLACHYPKEFYCACINNSQNSSEAGRFIDALKKRNIKIGNVNINKSQREYTIQNKKIIAGFAGLKYMSNKTIDQMIAIRGKGFKNWDDFDKRVPKKLVNKTALLSLYVAGAFKCDRDTEHGIGYRLGMDIVEMYTAINDQYNVCGQVIHDVKMDRHDRIQDLDRKSVVVIPAYVVRIKEIFTRNHDKMAFIVIEDITGRYEVTCFPQAWENMDVKIGGLYDFMLKYERGLIGLKTKKYEVLEDEEN